jgi:hypothetical protein
LECCEVSEGSRDGSGEPVPRKAKNRHVGKAAANFGRDASMELVSLDLQCFQRRQVVQRAWGLTREVVEGEFKALEAYDVAEATRDGAF